jgi:hypothetical protein
MRRWLALASLLLGVYPAAAQITISNVATVNVTPSSFSVVWSVSATARGSLIPSLSVFADAGGATNLAGQVGLEYYPLNSGAPTATNAYQERLSQAYLRQQSQSLGLVQVRVSGCSPNTAYYYQVRENSTNGQQAVWPPSAPLPAVTTAQENGFVLQSLQLLITLPPANQPGSIVMLSNTNTPSLLAAVIGDGAGSNQVYFSLNDLIAATGNTNFAPVGNQQFTGTVLGAGSNAAPQIYSLLFGTNFTVGQGAQFTVGQFLGMNVGSAAVQSGHSGSLPIGLVYGTGVTNLSFNLTLPTNAFSALSIQALSPQLNSAVLQPLASNLVSVTLATPPGQSLQGAQPLAQLNFTVGSNQPSAFVNVAAQSLRVANADGTLTTNVSAQAGQLVLVGNQPLLQTMLGPNATRSLALYGIPWDSYELQYSTNIGNPAAWTDLMRVPLTNIVQIFTGLDTHPAAIFYRAYQFAASPPVMDISSAPPGKVSIMAYGTTGTNYVLQYATNLTGNVAWYPLLSYTLTNSFQSIPNIAKTNPATFFRLKKP